MQPILRIISKSLAETEKIAADFSKKLKWGDVLGLCGDLGSGKTTFVRALFEALEGDPSYFVNSPTFTLLQEYPTSKGLLHHFDLYRLNSFAEWAQLDFEDFFKNGISAIEWADKFKEFLELLTYQIDFKFMGPYEREITINKRFTR